MLADICDRLPGADVDVVTQAVGCDSRIGGKYLRGAIGYGGPCFPRDNVAFTVLARSIGARAELAEATDTLNEYQVKRVLDAIHAHDTGTGPIGVLGLAYKPETSVIECSQGLAVVGHLVDAGRDVVAFDPKALGSAHAALGQRFRAAASAEECIRAASLVVLMTAWPQFRAVPPEAFARSPRLTVIDCWRLLSRQELTAFADVVHLGRGALHSTPTTA
jgi:UDPglucose 6-dehydrogenase